MVIDGEFVIVLAKFLLGVIILSILVFGIYLAMKPKTKSSAEIDSTKQNIIYVLWIGNTATTLHVLDLVQKLSTEQNQKTVIQPIFIPDPEDMNINNFAKREYELEITRELRKQIMAKYPQVGERILPIINITKLQPDDDAFNQGYDQRDGKNTNITNNKKRDAVLARWALYYNITLSQPSNAGIRRQRKTGDNKILINTWDCRFPVGKNQVPCGLCRKCEKLNNLG